MLSIIFYNHLDKKQKIEIDKILINSKIITYYYQSYIFGEKINFLKSGIPYYFFIKKKNNTIGYWLIFEYKKKGIKYISWANGPIWITDINNKEKKHITRKILHYFFCKKTFLIRNSKISKENLFLFKAFANKSATSIIDMQKDLSEIYNSFKSNIRKNLKKISDDIKIKIIDSEEEFYEYDKLMFIERNMLKISLPPYYPYRYWYHFFSKYYPDSYYVFKAYKENQTLGFLGIIQYLNSIIENGLVITDYAKKNNIAAGDLLKWEIINFFHKKGITNYDLAGFNPNPKTVKQKGLMQYKLKWNGTIYSEYIITGLTF